MLLSANASTSGKRTQDPLREEVNNVRLEVSLYEELSVKHLK